MSRIYLDYNATAPLRPQAHAAMLAAACLANPSAVHKEGREARAVIEQARETIARLCGASSQGVIFTSGGTEACNLAFNMHIAPAGRVKRIIVTAIEHAAILAPARASSLPVDILPVTPQGVIDVTALEALLENPQPALVCVMVANNQTGVIQPVVEVSERVRAHGSLLFCDAIQAAGKMPIDDLIGAGICDGVSVSAHKMGGTMGVGALVMADSINLRPLIHGGGQEGGHRSGSENVTGIAAFGAAAQCAIDELDSFQSHASWRDAMEQKLLDITPQIQIFGQSVPRLANTSCFAYGDISAQTMLMALDMAGVAVSAGAACASGKIGASHVLDAMKVPLKQAQSALRISLGWQSQQHDCAFLVDQWQQAVSQINHAA